MPSQYGEHEFIVDHFAGRVGRFLDVGAYDGLTYSNTRCLMELGWEGTCFEPNPMIFPYLLDNTKQFTKVWHFPMALVPDSWSGEATDMWVTQDALSTFSAEHRNTIQRHNKAVDYKLRSVMTLHWKDIPGTYDFVNIDVEGMNLELLRDMPFDRIDAQLICIELDPKRVILEIKSILRYAGYDNQKEIGGNLLAWDDR